MELLRRGKVKDVLAASAGELEFVFSDRISVFDKVIPTLVPRKGETLCRTSAHWFRAAENLGIKTHFLKVTGGNRMRVRRVEVIADYSRITPTTANYLIPLEVISRYYVAGSLHDRMQAGHVHAEDLGFRRGHAPAYGEELPQPFLEVTTKLEAVDRELGIDEARRIAGLTPEDFEEILEMVRQIDDELNRQVARRGLIHVDGKKEFAYDADRELMVVDTYGTADEDRFWDRAAYDEGRQVELSKEFVRQYFRSIGYHEKLMDARRAGETEPDIPPLPDEVRDEVSALYVSLFERLTGETFR